MVTKEKGLGREGKIKPYFLRDPVMLPKKGCSMELSENSTQFKLGYEKGEEIGRILSYHMLTLRPSRSCRGLDVWWLIC